MQGYRMTLHWEAMPLFRERHPDLNVLEQIFVIDGNRITCAGGAAATDMMLHLIALDMGTMPAQIVANGMVHSPQRYYLKIRLQAARNLLFYSDVPIQNVALSCGFSGAEVFSRSFRAHFGQSPREFRSDFSTDRLHRFHPEFVQRLG